MEYQKDTYKHFFGIPPPIGRNLEDSREESIILESANIRHGDNCDCCTSVKDSQRFGEEYQHKIQQAHKGRYIGFRAKRAKKQEKQQQQQRDGDFLPFPKQDDSNPMEDFEPI